MLATSGRSLCSFLHLQCCSNRKGWRQRGREGEGGKREEKEGEGKEEEGVAQGSFFHLMRKGPQAKFQSPNLVRTNPGISHPSPWMKCSNQGPVDSCALFLINCPVVEPASEDLGQSLGPASHSLLTLGSHVPL